MKFCIKGSNFELSFQIKVFESDIQYPSNSILTVSVNSDSFSANTNMDIDIKEFVRFTDALSIIYTTLDGVATIQEPYGSQQFIKFSGDRSGHIFVVGRLNSNGRSGFCQELTFENLIDQTYLPDFLDELTSFCAKYR